MENNTGYTKEEIKNKWLPNACKMYDYWMKRYMASNDKKCLKSAKSWQQTAIEYRAVISK